MHSLSLLTLSTGYPARSAGVDGCDRDRRALETQLRAALADFERGVYIELTPEQLERCIATGESPWPDESRG